MCIRSIIGLLAIPSVSCVLIASACGGSQSGEANGSNGSQLQDNASAEPKTDASSGQENSGDATQGEANSRQAATQAEVQQFMNDLLAANACDEIAGKYLPLAAAHAADVTSGRFRVEQCKAQRTDGSVDLQVSGRGWRWIDREKETLGAQFEVSQYARFEASLDATGTTGLDYAESEKVLALWYEPRRSSANVTPIGDPEVEAQGAWGSVLGTVASAFGASPSQQAEQKLEKRATQTFESKIEKGYTVGVNLCTSQRHTKFGKLQPQDLPDPPHPSADQIWMANQRVRLHPAGVDLAGPFQPADNDLRLELRGGDQGAIRAQLICNEQATQVAKAFLQDRSLPDVEAADERVVQPNELAHLRADTGRCPMVLMTTTAEGTSEAVTYEFMAYSAGEDRKDLVPCPN